MPLLLPVVWLLLFLAIVGSQEGLRVAAVTAFAAVTTIVLVSTEVLSLLHVLSFTWLALSWATAALVLGYALRGRIRHGLSTLREQQLFRWDRVDSVVAAVLAVFALGTLASALPLFEPDVVLDIAWRKSSTAGSQFGEGRAREIVLGPLTTGDVVFTLRRAP